MRKEFPDTKKVEKERRLEQVKISAPVTSKKGLKKSKKEVQAALAKMSLGWTTNDGKEF